MTVENKNEQHEGSVENAVADTSVVESLKAQVKELKADISAKNDELRRVKVNAAVDTALIAAGAKNIVAVKALIEGLDKMELLEDGSVKGLKEKIDAVKKSDGYLFEQCGKLTMRGVKPGESGYDSICDTADVSKMTYSQLTEFIKKNPSVKVFD